MKCVQRINKVKQMFDNKMISILASIMMIAFSVFYNLLALPVRHATTNREGSLISLNLRY